MFDFFDSVKAIFDFIYSVFDTIVQGINGIISIITSLIGLVLNIAKLLPSPLYPCFVIFVNLYLVIYIYHIFRKG